MAVEVKNRVRTGQAWAKRGMNVLRAQFDSRFVPVWLGLGMLIVFSMFAAPASLERTSLQAIMPFAAFLAVAAMGQAIVVMNGGIDLSIPAIMTMVGVILLDVSGGNNANLAQAVAVALGMATLVGAANGVLVSRFRLNALVVTLAMGTLVTGGTFWFRGGVAPESRVPPALADWGANRAFGISYPAFVAVALMVLITLILHYTVAGRRFTAAGASPRAAYIAGVRVEAYQIGAYAIAGLLYGITAIMLAAFIRTPGLQMGSPYLLPTVVAVVIGGASLAGGTGSVVATVGGALFIVQLEQALRVMGASSAYQFILEGGVIALSMLLSTHLSSLSGAATAIRRFARTNTVWRAAGKGVQ